MERDLPSATNTCSECGRTIPPNARKGLCPSCVAKSLGADLFGGLDDDDDHRSEVARVPRPKAGPEIPDYELLGILGEGAAGVVWTARELQPPRREVALKILKAELVTGDSGVRFEAEMAVLALMDHPGIARVFGSGKTADGRPFFAMERIDGASVTAFCENGTLNLRQRLEIFRKLCEAIAHAHRRGIIHRDIKPSNVLVAETAARSPQPKVIDFGIAKATENLLTEQTLLTQANVFMGTPAYMSPEQAAMKGDLIDTRTDIYSLGVVLYEIITGRTPLPGKELVGIPYDEVMRRIRTEDPSRPSAVTGNRFEVDTDLDWIAMKALEKDPDRRYESADAFARDIENYLEGDTVTARPPTVTYRMRKYVRRHRIPVVATSAVALAMIAGTIVSFLMYLQSEENAALAQMQAGRAERSDARGKEIFSDADFTQSSPLLDEHRPALAVAHLARAVRTNPGNQAAATRLLHTLGSENWAAPHASLPLNGHIVFSGDGARVVVAPTSIPGVMRHRPILKIFSVSSGSELHHYNLEADAACVALGPDGNTLAVGTVAGTVSLWNIASGEKIQQLGDPRLQSCTQLVFSASGKRLAAAYPLGGGAHVWELPEGRLLASLNLAAGKVAVSSKGDLVAAASGSQLRVFDVDSGKAVSKPLEHDDSIVGLGFLPDGGLVSWSKDSSAKVWDTATGEAKMTLTHDKEISAGAVSPDGSRLLTGTTGKRGEKGAVRIWDLTKGNVIGKSIQHPGNVTSVAFGANGTVAVSGSAVQRLGDGAVNVFDAWTGELLAAPVFHPRGAESVKLSTDGTFLAISSRHKETAIWELQRGAMRPMRLLHRLPVWRAIFEETGERLSVLTLTYYGEARRWDAATGEALSPAQTFGPVAVSAHAASGANHLREGIFVRQPLRLKDRIAPKYHEGGVVSAAASGDGRLLVTGCADGKIRLWSLESGEHAMPPLEGAHEGAVTALALNASSDRLISGGKEGRLAVWDVRSGERLGSAEVHQLKGFDLQLISGSDSGALPSEGRSLVVVGLVDDKTRIRIFGSDGKRVIDKRDHDLIDGPTRIELEELLRSSSFPVASELSAGEKRAIIEKVMSIAGYNQVRALAVSPDGRTVASGSRNGSAQLWWIDSEPQLSPLLDNVSRVNHLAFSPDGKVLAVSGTDNAARLWDAANGDALGQPMRHIDGATYGNFLIWTSDSQRLVTAGSHDNTARFWNAATGAMISKPMEQPNAATAVALRPDGKALLYGAAFSRVWHLASGEPLTPLFAQDRGTESVAFDSSGRRFVTGSLGGSVYVHDLPAPNDPLPDALLDFAEAVGGFRFNEAGVLEQVPGAPLQATGQRVRSIAAGANGSAAVWMRWLATPAAKRTTSPESTVSFEHFAGQLTAEGTLDSLREAVHLRPNDPELLAQLGVLHSGKGDTSDGDRQFGRFLVERAVHLAPQNFTVKLARVESMLADKETEGQGLLEGMRILVANRSSAAAWQVIGKAMGKRHWHFDEAVAFDEARHLFEKDGNEAKAAMAASDRDRVRRKLSARQQEVFDHFIASSREHASALISLFGALVSNDPASAVRLAANELDKQPEFLPAWGRLGEISLLVSELRRLEGDASATDYLRAGCAALTCGAACNTRYRELGRILASGRVDGEDAVQIPWIRKNSQWVYLDGESARTPPSDWMQPDFDDSRWQQGEAPFGYGDGNETTTIDFGADPAGKVITTYFRQTFHAEPIGAARRLQLAVRRDDGAVVYLNGQEVFRSNMPEGTVSPETPAVQAISDAAEATYVSELLSSKALTAGDNLVAVEVHQTNQTSSDLSFDLELKPGFAPAVEQLAAIEDNDLAGTLGLSERALLWMQATHAIDQGKFESSRELLSAAWELAPESLEIAVNLGYVYYRLDDLKMAEEVFAKGVAEAERQGKKHGVLEQNLEYIRSRLANPG